MRALKIAAVIAVIVLLAANTVLLAATSNTLSSVEASLEEVEANTAPASYAEAFCENDTLLSDMYDEIVYDGPDNITQQAHRQREFRAQVLIYCNR